MDENPYKPPRLLTDPARSSQVDKTASTKEVVTKFAVIALLAFTVCFLASLSAIGLGFAIQALFER